MSVLRGDITYCCREIICLYKISEIIPSPSLTVFFSSTHRNINRNVIGSTIIRIRIVFPKWRFPRMTSAFLAYWRFFSHTIDAF